MEEKNRHGDKVHNKVKRISRTLLSEKSIARTMEQHSFTSTKRQTNGKTILRYPVKISSKVKAGFRESQFSFN